MIENLSLDEMKEMRDMLSSLIKEKTEDLCDRTLENAIQFLAKECDGALNNDGVGFSAADVSIGHLLSNTVDSWGSQDARKALALCQKYNKQLSDFVIPQWKDVSHQYQPCKSAARTISLEDGVLKLRCPYDPNDVWAAPNNLTLVKDCNPKPKFRKLPSGDAWWEYQAKQVCAQYLVDSFSVGFVIEPEVFDFLEEENKKQVVLDEANALKKAADDKAKAKKERAEKRKAKKSQLELDKLIEAAELDKPILCGYNYFEHQKEGIKWLLATKSDGYKGRILADDMGLGKSLESLGAAKALHKVLGLSVVVVCPASLKSNWIREAQMVGVPIEVYSWAKQPQPLRDKYILIGDECFPEEASVLTNLGHLPIGEIVDNKRDVLVMSKNLVSGSYEWKPITRWISHKRRTKFVRVTHESGQIICTENHKIYTNEHGWTKAKDLCTKEGGTSLCTVSERVYDSLKREIDCEVLFPELLVNRKDRTEEEVGSYRKQKVRMVQERISGNRKGPNKRAEILFKELCELPQSKSAGSSRKVTRNNKDRSSGNQRSYSFIADMLQSRSSVPGFEVSDRSGRSKSQSPENKRQGQKERERTECSRVVSVEVLGPRDIERLGIGGKNSEIVYNLEVEDNHNYFTEGVLVSNCHACQSLKSKRCKDFTALSAHKNCYSSYMLTGTPMKNGRPINLFPLLRICGLDISKNKKKYEQKYCNGHVGYFGWDNTGSSHLKELRDRITPVMLQRKKKDCTDLPGKMRVIRSVSISVAERKNYERDLRIKVQEYRDREDAKAAEEGRSPNYATQALVMMGYLRSVGSVYKIPETVALAQEVLESGSPIVIFVERLETGFELQKQLGGEFLHGGVANKDRQPMVDRFQSGESKVFIGTSGAAGTGHTLTKANTVIIHDRAWTPGDVEQCEDRSNRIGQTSTVTVIWPQLENSIDIRVDEILAQKAAVIEKVMDGVDNPVNASASIKKLASEILEEYS